MRILICQRGKNRIHALFVKVRGARNSPKGRMSEIENGSSSPRRMVVKDPLSISEENGSLTTILLGDEEVTAVEA